MAQEVATAMGRERWAYELVFVDDASTDGTWRNIHEARRVDGRIRGLRLARNGGQSVAVWTGIQATTSPILATMDGDRQNDPADFPKLLAELGRYDFVCGIRMKRQDTLLRRFSALVARQARKLVLRVDFVDTGCGLRVFKRSTLESVFPFNGMHRFLPVLVHGGGARTCDIPVNHRPRVAGASKYGVWNRLWRGMADLLAIARYQRRRFGRVPFQELDAAANPARHTLPETGPDPTAGPARPVSTRTGTVS